MRSFQNDCERDELPHPFRKSYDRSTMIETIFQTKFRISFAKAETFNNRTKKQSRFKKYDEIFQQIEKNDEEKKHHRDECMKHE